jgi:hypothetical protein
MGCRLADRLSCLCAALNLSITDFATHLDLPLRRAKRVLKPERKPSLKLLNRVHRAFPQVSTLWLFCGEGQMFIPAPTPTATSGNYVGNNYGTLHQTIYHGSHPPAAH